jgi:threonine dehydrogenase-like Zn-dependent dehydrogenase
MCASTICGSDLRAIYRQHLGSGPEAYQGVIGGHEPSGVGEAIGPGVNRVRPGDRVVVYHISGYGQCDECRRGYQISCDSPQRAAYGWQRDGAPSIFGAPVTVPAPLKYVAVGAARQAAWALRSRAGNPDLPGWTSTKLAVRPLNDPVSGERVRAQYGQLRETVHPR